jgi:hypothetical protein
MVARGNPVKMCDKFTHGARCVRESGHVADCRDKLQATFMLLYSLAINGCRITALEASTMMEYELIRRYGYAPK